MFDIYLFIPQWIIWLFPPLGECEYATVNTNMQTSVCVSALNCLDWCIPRNGMLEPMKIVFLSF